MSVFRKIFSHKILPSWTILLMDAMLVMFAGVIAYLLRFSVPEISKEIGNFWFTLGCMLIVNVAFFKAFHTYANVLRLSSFVDIINIFVALTLSFIVLMFLSIVLDLFHAKFHLHISILIITLIVSFVLMSMFRMSLKTINDYLNHDHKRQLNTFIYGTKIGGINIAKSIRMTQMSNFNLCGFIADDPAMKGKVMMGVNVYLNDDKLADHLHEHSIKAVIVSHLKQERLKETDFADRMLKEGIQVFSAPGIVSGSEPSTEPGVIRSIQIEDLLGRTPIEINLKKIAGVLEGRKVLITGAAGSIGSEITRQVAQFNPYQLILIDQAETPLHDLRLEMKGKWKEMDAPTIIADISNAERMEDIFRRYRPDFVFHAAAYKHVPMMEDNVTESIQNNVLGTKVVADLSLKYGVEKFVMVSTDKAVNPSNVMGCSKRICEIYIQALAKKEQKDNVRSTQFITTRFGNVLGSNGSVIPLFRKQIENGGPVTVTHPDIIRYFMTIPEACRLVLEAGCMGQGGEIYIFDMGEPVKIVDLAEKMIALSGRSDVKIEFTGLRHGEKLYEELLNVKENTKPTSHDKIMIANVREYDYDTISKDIDELIRMSYTFDPMETVAKMKAIVPEYKSLNSQFSSLDRVNKTI